MRKYTPRHREQGARFVRLQGGEASGPFTCARYIDKPRRGNGGTRHHQCTRLEKLAPFHLSFSRVTFVRTISLSKLANAFDQRRNNVWLSFQIRIRRHRGAKSDRTSYVHDDNYDLLIAHRLLPFPAAKILRLRVQICGPWTGAASIVPMAHCAAFGKYRGSLSPCLRRYGTWLG